jgi:hypothetical protein
MHTAQGAKLLSAAATKHKVSIRDFLAGSDALGAADHYVCTVPTLRLQCSVGRSDQLVARKSLATVVMRPLLEGLSTTGIVGHCRNAP